MTFKLIDSWSGKPSRLKICQKKEASVLTIDPLKIPYGIVRQSKQDSISISNVCEVSMQGGRYAPRVGSKVLCFEFYPSTDNLEEIIEFLKVVVEEEKKLKKGVQ